MGNFHLFLLLLDFKRQKKHKKSPVCELKAKKKLSFIEKCPNSWREREKEKEKT